MKILVIGPSWVGDMVMSQSLYQRLKQQHPDAQIDVLAPAWCKPILERMPEVNQAIEMTIGHGAFNLLGRRAIGCELRDNRYTHAIVLPNSAKSALIPWFANIPKRPAGKGNFATAYSMICAQISVFSNIWWKGMLLWLTQKPQCLPMFR